MASEVKEEKVNPKTEMLEKYKEGIRKVLDSDEYKNWCKSSGKLYYNKYSMRNAMLVWLQKQDSSHVQGYEAWKEYGRQVKKGATGIKIITPTFFKDYKGEGTLFRAIDKALKDIFNKNQNEKAKYTMAESNLVFTFNKAGYGLECQGKTIVENLNENEIKAFISKNVLNKAVARYSVATVFDIKDTTDDVEYLWLKNGFKKEEMVKDEKGKPIKNNFGQYKIYNSDERRGKLVTDLDITIPEGDKDKMETLLSTLKDISTKRNIHVYEVEEKNDGNLSGGAKGYYQKTRPDIPNVKECIVLKQELNMTEKVSVLFHEMAHSQLHNNKNLDYLKENLGENITRQMKEIQAESVACMTASNFGIETETSSFKYLAAWSKDEKGLKELERSMNVIYNESQKMMSEIQNELKERGMNLKLEYENIPALEPALKKDILESYQTSYLDEKLKNDDMRGELSTEIAVLTGNIEKIVSKQIVVSKTIENKINELKESIDKFEKTNIGSEENKQMDKISKILSAINKDKSKIEQISLERIDEVNRMKKEQSQDIKSLFYQDVNKVLIKLSKETPELLNLNDIDKAFITKSTYIKDNIGLLVKDSIKFSKILSDHVKNFNSVKSKNGTVVEIGKCEKWGEKAFFEAGTLINPRMANKMIKEAEVKVQKLKIVAAKENQFYPFHKCNVNVFTKTNKGLQGVKTQICIGDGNQTDLKTHLKDIDVKDKEQFKEIYNNFEKALTERRGKDQPKILIPASEEQKFVDDLNKTVEEENVVNEVLSMEQWKDEIDANKEDKKELEKSSVRDKEH